MANESVPGAAPEGVADNATSAETAQFGKYASLDELKKGQVEGDKHIEVLEAELEELRLLQNTSMNMESFLEKLGSDATPQSEPTSSEPAVHREEAVTQTANLSVDDIDKLVSQKVNQIAAKSQLQSNYSNTMVELEKTYGSGFGTNVRVATTALGETDDFMNNLAANNPKAFLKLVHAAQPDRPSNVNPAAPPTKVNTSFAPLGATRNEEFYSTLRKKDNDKYWSHEVQSQMQRDAQSQGESFFKSNR